MEVINSLRITQTAATVAALMGFSMPTSADEPNGMVLDAARARLGDRPVQRALLYNPDAIALWLYQKYTPLFAETVRNACMARPVRSGMPTVTPVCFASMYAGLEPEAHGIRSYVKPVLQVPTLFDAAIDAGRRPIIISTEGDSISKIFLNRKMDYLFCKTPDDCNAHALDVLRRNEHDLVVVYNGNYDAQMHRTGPESREALAQPAVCAVPELAAGCGDLAALAQQLARNEVVIATEVGGGVVPVDKNERAAREAAGRLGCLLAQRADAVVRVFCGIPVYLKGAPNT